MKVKQAVHGSQQKSKKTPRRNRRKQKKVLNSVSTKEILQTKTVIRKNSNCACSMSGIK